jgi:hypothetical protein
MIQARGNVNDFESVPALFGGSAQATYEPVTLILSFG